MPSSQSIPAAVDFVHYQGDTFKRTLTFNVDITGWTFEGQLRRRFADDDPAVVATFGVEPVTSKSITITLGGMITQGLTDNYVHDLQAGLPTGEMITLIAGRFIIRQEVTR